MVEDEHVPQVLEVVQKQAKTGNFGDGKVFVSCGYRFHHPHRQKAPLQAPKKNNRQHMSKRALQPQNGHWTAWASEHDAASFSAWQAKG